jgi:Na+:H+ antiporter
VIRKLRFLCSLLLKEDFSLRAWHLGKWIAAEIAGRAFKYPSAARLTMWSLTLPQVATTLAATLVAFNTFNPLHQRLIDDRMLHVVLVLMLITATLGSVLTQHFVPRMLEAAANKEARVGRDGS